MSILATRPTDPETARRPGVERVRTQIISRSRAGERVRVEEFVLELGAAGASDEDWHDLIVTEIRARRERGEDPTAGEYAARFPEYAPRMERYFEEPLTCRLPPSGLSEVSKRAATATVRVPGYEILEVLGRGGMGIVYKARHIKLNRLVALKMILAGRFAGDEDLQRFWREAEDVAALNHPNIVRVYEVGEHDGSPFFSLEYVGGGTLAERLNNGPLLAHEAAAFASDIARAAHAAHEHGIIHRDLKPANILLAKSEQSTQTANMKATRAANRVVRGEYSVPKVTDFGIAKRLNEVHGLTASGIAAGTPQYMAPEQALATRAKPVGPASDVYAIGAVMYEMLTGRPPFDAESPVAVMKQVVSEAPTAPGRLNSRIPKDLETICLKCLEKEPERRYKSASALADDLDRWQRGQAISARHVGRVGQGWRWCKRNPLVAALLGGIMFALTAGTSVAGSLAIRANRFADESARNAREADENAEIARRNAVKAERQAQESKQNAAEAKASESRANTALEAEAALRVEADERERRRARELYAAHMAVGHDAWETGHVANTRALLEKYRPLGPNSPDLRGFEWYYLSRLIRPYEANLSTLQGPLSGGTAIPRTEQWALCNQQSLLFWDPATSGLTTWRPPFGDALASVSLSADGKTLAVGTSGPKLHLHNLGANKPIATIQLHSAGYYRAMSLIFAGDGKTLYVAVGSDSHIYHPGFVASYSVATGELIRRYEGATATFRAMALSPDGTIVAAGGQTGEFRLWETATGTLLRQIPSRGGICSLGFSGDGKLLLGGSGVGTIGAWDPNTGRLLRSMKGHLDWVDHLVVAPDGRHMATAAAEGVIRLWDTNTGEEILNFNGHEGRITGLAFSGDSKKLLSTADDGGACVWDTTRDASVITRSVAFPECDRVLPLPDNRHAVVVNDWCDYQFIDFRNGDMTPPVRPKNVNANLCDAAVSSDGRTLLLGTYQKGAYFVSLTEPSSDAKAVPNGGGGMSVAYSADGKWFAIGYKDGRVIVRSATGSSYAKSLGKMHKTILSLAFDPRDSNRLATVCYDGTVRVWDHASGSEELALELLDHQPVHVAFSPDGRKLATAGASDNVARVWDSWTGKMLGKFEGHTSGVECVAFDPSGNRLATGSKDLTVKVWDVETALPVLTLRGHTRTVKRLAFDREGSSLMSVGGAHVKVWDGHPGYLYEQGRLLAAGLKLRSPRVEWAPNVGVKGAFSLVNEGSTVLSVPRIPLGQGRLKVHISVERLGSDPRIPAIGDIRLDATDQYRLIFVNVMPLRPEFEPGAISEGNFQLSTAGWPAGKYRIYLELSWGNERNFTSSTTTSFAIPD